MKIVSSLVLGIMFFTGCSQKIVSTKSECRDMESTLNKLEQEKKLNLAGKIVNLGVTGYPIGLDGTKLEQNIKVLKMKLDECNR